MLTKAKSPSKLSPWDMDTGDNRCFEGWTDRVYARHSQWPPFETESAPPTAMAVEKDQQLPAYHACMMNKLMKEVGELLKGGTYY